MTLRVPSADPLPLAGRHTFQAGVVIPLTAPAASFCDHDVVRSGDPTGNSCAGSGHARSRLKATSLSARIPRLPGECPSG
jgi:hypothetical protein